MLYEEVVIKCQFFQLLSFFSIPFFFHFVQRKLLGAILPLGCFGGTPWVATMLGTPSFASTWLLDARLPTPSHRFSGSTAEDVAIVLVGHLALPLIDPTGAPATISPVLIDELLRDELGFEGVVMTDALNMSAIDYLGRDEVVVGAVLAGADILLYPPDLQVAYEAVVAAVESGEISEERIDASVLRVLRLKEQLGLLPNQ